MEDRCEVTNTRETTQARYVAVRCQMEVLSIERNLAGMRQDGV